MCFDTLVITFNLKIITILLLRGVCLRSHYEIYVPQRLRYEEMDQKFLFAQQVGNCLDKERNHIPKAVLQFPWQKCRHDLDPGRVKLYLCKHFRLKNGINLHNKSLLQEELTVSLSKRKSEWNVVHRSTNFVQLIVTCCLSYMIEPLSTLLLSSHALHDSFEISF